MSILSTSLQQTMRFPNSTIVRRVIHSIPKKAAMTILAFNQATTLTSTAASANLNRNPIAGPSSSCLTVPRLTRPYSTAPSSSTPPPPPPPPPSPPSDQGERAIYDKLAERFPGKQLQVEDVSGGCGSFYAILISSPKFKGLSTIKQHKLVNECLKEDIKGIHGLQLKTIVEE